MFAPDRYILRIFNILMYDKTQSRMSATTVATHIEVSLIMFGVRSQDVSDLVADSTLQPPPFYGGWRTPVRAPGYQIRFAR